MRRETFQKLALLLFGLVLGLVLLEAGLRTAGFVVLYFQERSNRQALEQRSGYVILCLGESTTAVGGDDSYPKQLERVLNENDPGRQVTVVNKGIIGTNTTAIVSRLPEYLDEYHPDMVITMMGINEGRGPEEPGVSIVSEPGNLFSNLRVHKLFRLTWDRVRYNFERARSAKQIAREEEDILALAESALSGDSSFRKRAPALAIPEEAGGHMEIGDRHYQADEFAQAAACYRQALQADQENREILTRLALSLRETRNFREDREALRRLLILDPRDPDVYVELGNSFREQEAWTAAEKFYRKAIDLNPELARPHLEWGNLYRRQGNVQDAIPLYLKAIELEPDNKSISVQLVRLARYYDTLGDYEQAEKLHLQALAVDPDYADGYAQLGRFYDWRGRNRDAEKMCRRAVEIDPEHELAWAELGDIFKSRGQKDQAIKMYQKALEIDPLNNIAFRILSVWYLEEGNYEKLEALCRGILEIDPRNDVALGITAVCRQARGEEDSAKEYFARANELRAGTFNPKVAENHRKAQKMAREKGIPLVCVQYPMRKVDNLKRMFPDPGGIIFVDNEAVFKTALESVSYADLFTDCFAGDFGHCTPRGNRLLAENIAGTILPVIRGERSPAGDAD